MGLLSLSYTRPKYVSHQPFRNTSSSDSLSDAEKSDATDNSSSSRSSTGIPDSLSFDRIIGGGTCPPMTVRDFMTYLIYVEHAAENLQFYLWFQDYEKRFNANPTTDVKLAPEWTRAMQDEAVIKIRKEQSDKMRKESEAAAIFKGSDFEKKVGSQDRNMSAVDPFATPPQSSKGDDSSIYTASCTMKSLNAMSHQSQASDAFKRAGAQQPFTIQPFREEINRVISTYIMEGAPRQLNLSSSEQKAVIVALSKTTHPSAFRSVFKTVDSSLRHQAHPNFIRWSICNGNPARVFFARSLGVGLIAAGIVVGLILTLSNAGRGYRALAAIALVLGISTLVAAYKGMCVVLHGMHHRHVRPWELFVDSENMEDAQKQSFDSFGSQNSYEDEPWVVKYEKRNVVRKVFDREVWIQEPALRQIQDTIFVQAILASVLLGGIVTAIFVAVPGGHFF
ncbi:hypothetical protein FOXG_03121 [Fusarium oxysporum f. sp. lycopersici 4287]|uniref:RGS domain-containing protein n=5 Tax=Fusarium oxysporum TaxID=5507 RepID=A0A0J9UHN4_FUSO4|nr:hypothetical protein FOXG_03121 [Fusarium oxysporum f. sp. lycopersici 4287]EXK34152.1 hypothetical protein FOMG_11236 [Fusarium oxysporum f. sp. melonis 26406]KAJ9420820.1 hypothetical protein QL093DRAFT_2341881 [Fusarium oxysporum]KNA98943.1 hypothetical protein FOXG_03121 [Fusarium oxysporum f. sp. lycopersici 4287]